MEISANKVFALFVLALKRLFADEAVPLAGNIAFRTMFSIFPFLIFLTSLAGFVGSADLAKQIVNYLVSVAPQQLVRPLSAEITGILTVPHSGLLSVSAILTIWSAMAGVDSIRVALNRAYDIRETRNIFVIYAQNVVFVIGAAVLLLSVAVLLVVIPVVTSLLANYAPEQLVNLGSIERLRYPVAILLLVTGLYVAHQALPARRSRATTILPGILLTVIVWLALTEIFSFWLLRFNTFASTYASLSGIFAAMFFLYLAALVLIFGGEFNRVLMLLKEPPA